jgi:(2Fe-2S) ferredoxin
MGSSRKDRDAALASRVSKAHVGTMQRHVLVCTESDCDAKRTTFKRIKHAVAEAGLRKRVTVSEVGCLDICEFGPICVVYPEGTWYHSVKGKTADAIVAEHLAAGTPVARRRFHTNDLGGGEQA